MEVTGHRASLSVYTKNDLMMPRNRNFHIYKIHHSLHSWDFLRVYLFSQENKSKCLSNSRTALISIPYIYTLQICLNSVVCYS